MIYLCLIFVVHHTYGNWSTYIVKRLQTEWMEVETLNILTLWIWQTEIRLKNEHLTGVEVLVSQCVYVCTCMSVSRFCRVSRLWIIVYCSVFTKWILTWQLLVLASRYPTRYLVRISLVHQHCFLTANQEWWGADVLVCLERGADDLNMVHLTPLPTHLCFIKMLNGSAFLVPP